MMNGRTVVLAGWIVANLWAGRTAMAVEPAASQPAGAGRDWPMWGGRPERNMASMERGLAGDWDVKSGKSIRWAVELGSQTFGNPVVAGGRVFIGTNNGRPRDPVVTGDKGVLMCFAEADGTFLWQAVHDKLPAGDDQDWSDIGITSTPCVAGDRVWYVSNRCELVCADVDGFGDGRNDGPFTGETRTGPKDADIVWSLDMMGKLGVVPLFASASAPLVVGDLVFVVTGNGGDEETGRTRRPQAPSFIAVRRDTGEVAWADASPGEHIETGQWSSPAYGIVRGRPQVAFPGGDGWLYAFNPATGEPLWKFNCIVQEPRKPDHKPGTLNSLLATPVFYQDRVYIAIGQDPEKGDGEGCIRAIDAAGRGDVTGSAEVWRLAGKDFGRSVSTVAIRDELLYAVEVGGYLNCLDLNTGKRFWRHDVKCGVWGSPVVADGKVYLTTDDGDALVFTHGNQARPPTIHPLTGSTHGTVAVANGTIFLADRAKLYAIAGK